MLTSRDHMIDKDINWLILGCLISLGYLSGLARWPAGTMISTVLATCTVIFMHRRAGAIWCLTLMIVLWAHWLNGPQTLGWDIASFELQTFHDWLHGQRPAYWDYSMLSSVFHGAWSTLGTRYITLVYGMSCLCFCAAITLAIDRMNTTGKWLTLVGTFIILTKIANSIFMLGKGDMLCAAFSLVSLSYVLLAIRDPGSERLFFRACNAALFGMLALSTKLSAVIFVAPAAAVLIWKHPRLLKQARTLAAFSLFAGLPLIPAALNHWKYGSVLDQEGAKHASQYSIQANLAEFFGSILPSPHFIPSAITALAMYSAWKIWGKNDLRPQKMALWLALLACILCTPWVWLNGPDSPDNFRLVAFPVFGMLILSQDD